VKKFKQNDYFKRQILAFNRFESEFNILNSANIPKVNWLLYPFIRSDLFYFIKWGNQNQNVYHAVGNYKLFRSFLRLLELLKFFCLRSIVRKSVIVFTSSQHEIILNENKKINKYSFAFEEELPKETLIITDTSNLYLLARVLSFFINIKLNYSAINEFIDKVLVSHNILKPNCKFDVKDYININLKVAEVFAYRIFFYLARPKFIIVEDGHYSYRTSLIFAAKSLKIKTAEFQHGIIFKNHFTYNLGKKLLSTSNYANYYPDFLLLWGKHWLSQSSTHSKKISIGNEWFHFLTKQRKESINKILSSILIICSTVEDDYYLKVLENLQKNRRKLFIRFHPLYVKPEHIETVTNKFGSTVEIDKSKDIHEAFYKYEYVISEFSTVNYEGVFINDNTYILKESYMKYNGNIDNEYFNYISLNELNNFDAHLKIKKTLPPLEEIHGSNFNKNYRVFLNQLCKP